MAWHVDAGRTGELPPAGDLDAERLAATAGRLGGRVIDHEPATSQVVDEINTRHL